MDFNYLWSVVRMILLEGVGKTLLLFAVVIVISIPLGFLVTLLSKCRVPPLRWIANAYIFIMRGTPLLLQLVFIFYGFPIIGNSLASAFHMEFFRDLFQLERMNAAFLGFSLNYAAYFAEIFRGGLLAIDKGQYEAAKVLGFSKPATTMRIIFPQMIRVALPSVANETITLIKDTSLLYAVAIQETINVAQSIVNRDSNILPLVVAAAVYLVLVFILTIFFKWLESKFNHDKPKKGRKIRLASPEQSL